MIHHHQHKRSYFWLYVLKSAPDRVYGDVSVSNAVMMFCWASCCFRQTCFRSETHLRVWSWFFFFFSSDRLFPPSWIRVVSPHQRVSLRFPRLTNQPQHPRASPETSRYTYERARALSSSDPRTRAHSDQIPVCKSVTRRFDCAHELFIWATNCLFYCPGVAHIKHWFVVLFSYWAINDIHLHIKYLLTFSALRFHEYII